MSKLSDRFRAAGIINTWDLLTRFAKFDNGRLAIAIDYRPGSSGRGSSVAKTAVWSPLRKLAPDAHWQDAGAKTFVGKRERSQPPALAWACALTGTTAEEWAADPTSTGRGVLIHKSIRAAALTWLATQPDR